MSSKKNFAVVLSGCGRADGSEIHEATMALLAIDIAGHNYQCFAPNAPQAKTINHANGEIMSVRSDKHDRNVLIESARIARGDIKDLKEYNAEDFDAIIFPGGIGAIMNLCNYEEKGINCQVNSVVEKAIKDTYNQEKVIGAMCIAPVLISRVLGKEDIVVTIGNDKKTASDIKAFGAKHMDTPATNVCVDKKHKIVTTPAYMLSKSIKEVQIGADKMIRAIVDLF